MTQFYVLAGAIGPTEIILIVVVIVLLFGGRKIPELMKGIGQGMKEFKKASQLESEDKSADLKEDKKETIK
jgi:sec-independent protein translocase protein TatA